MLCVHTYMYTFTCAHTHTHTQAAVPSSISGIYLPAEPGSLVYPTSRAAMAMVRDGITPTGDARVNVQVTWFVKPPSPLLTNPCTFKQLQSYGSVISDGFSYVITTCTLTESTTVMVEV